MFVFVSSSVFLGNANETLIAPKFHLIWVCTRFKQSIINPLFTQIIFIESNENHKKICNWLIDRNWLYNLIANDWF